MSQFCPKCGKPIRGNERFCGNCGASLKEERVEQAVLSGSQLRTNGIAVDKEKIKKWIIPAGAVAVTVVIIALVASMLLNSSGYKGTVKLMAQAIQEEDAELMTSLTSSIQQDISGEEQIYERWESAIKNDLDRYEDRVGEIKKITITITNVDEVSERRLDNAMEYIENNYNVDTSDVQKAVRVDLKEEIKGKKKSMTDREDGIYLIKEKNKWKIYFGEGF